jgi:adenylosuccinate synthase
MPDGRRHVFSHFGSGSFSGAKTLLSRFFLVNPITFVNEYLELSGKLPQNMEVLIDSDAAVTTPYDMLLNQSVEQQRGEARHGSCGLGINETITRGEKFLKIRAADLWNVDKLRTSLTEIRDRWVPYRKQQLKLISGHPMLLAPDLIDRFIEEVRSMTGMRDYVQEVHDADVIRAAQAPIFEGAQGLLLDQDHEFFPHVTRSSTGIKNVVTLASEAGVSEVEVYYMTRAYLTRHGAGPLPGEQRELPWKIVDETNVPNKWQGSLRFAFLNTDLLKKTILDDLKTNQSLVKIKPRLGITCLDQVGKFVSVFSQNRYNGLHGSDDEDVGDQIARAVGMFGNHLKSFGPTRDDVVDYLETVDRRINQEVRAELRIRKSKKGKLHEHV